MTKCVCVCAHVHALVYVCLSLNDYMYVHCQERQEVNSIL